MYTGPKEVAKQRGRSTSANATGKERGIGRRVQTTKRTRFLDPARRATGPACTAKDRAFSGEPRPATGRERTERKLGSFPSNFSTSDEEGKEEEVEVGKEIEEETEEGEDGEEGEEEEAREEPEEQEGGRRS
ncbi:cyclin-dependent kinase 11B-like [Bombus affinis]|uniref:cyclin-dependent kinase 11B-like n=1 Tax=Bombus affinis TaxID=309941 RepID=UPI0021B725B3|nr:cyclin-dependent kinase 11B-like [Bombus affinis]